MNSRTRKWSVEATRIFAGGKICLEVKINKADVVKNNDSTFSVAKIFLQNFGVYLDNGSS